MKKQTEEETAQKGDDQKEKQHHDFLKGSIRRTHSFDTSTPTTLLIQTTSLSLTPGTLVCLKSGAPKECRSEYVQERRHEGREDPVHKLRAL